MGKFKGGLFGGLWSKKNHLQFIIQRARHKNTAGQNDDTSNNNLSFILVFHSPLNQLLAMDQSISSFCYLSNKPVQCTELVLWFCSDYYKSF